jgi:hypothetical protein
LPASTPGGRRARLEAYDKQEIDGFNRTISVADAEGPTWWSLSQEFRMLD